MKSVRILLGSLIVVVLGFFLFVLTTGIGVLIGIVLWIFPQWQIVVGTFAGSICVIVYLIRVWK